MFCSRSWYPAAFALACLATAALSPSQGTAAPKDKDEKAPKGGKKHALLIGVTKYDSKALEPLKFAHEDVSQLGKLLEKKHEFDKVVVMTSEEATARKDDALKPTAENIRKQLKDLLVKSDGEKDTVWIGLVGHGFQATVAAPKKTGADSMKNGHDKLFMMFCPSDANRDEKIEYATGKAKTLLNVDKELFEPLGKCGAGLKVVLVDACRDEKELEGRGLKAGGMLLPANTLALFSCDGGQRARESKKLGHGVFFHFVIEALDGKVANKDGNITWARFSEYVADNVEKYVKNIGGGAEQTPYAYSGKKGSSVLLKRR